MNQQTIEQVRNLLETAIGCGEMKYVESALAALSSAESEPTDDRIKFGVITWDGVKYPQILFQGQPMFWGDDPHEEDHSSYMREFIEFLQARLSPPSTHSDVSQDGGNGEAKPIWEELAEIGQEAAAKGAFDQPEAPALTERPREDLRIVFALEHKHGTQDMRHIPGKDDYQFTPQQLVCFVRALSAPVQAAVEPIPIEYATDPDGELSLDWTHGDITISISIGGSGKLSWVTDVGGAVTSGSREFSTTNAQASPDAQAIRDQALEEARQCVANASVSAGYPWHPGTAHAVQKLLMDAIEDLKSKAPQPVQDHIGEADDMVKPSQEVCETCGAGNSEFATCQFCKAIKQPSQVKEPPVSLTSDEVSALEFLREYRKSLPASLQKAGIGAVIATLTARQPAALTQPAAEADEREAFDKWSADYDYATNSPRAVWQAACKWLRAALAQSPARQEQIPIQIDEQAVKQHIRKAYDKGYDNGRHDGNYAGASWYAGGNVEIEVGNKLIYVLKRAAQPQQGATK